MTMIKRIIEKTWLLIIVSFLCILTLYCKRQDNIVGIYCNEDNDLYQLLIKSNNQNYVLYDDINVALKEVATNGTLLLLAKDYPENKTILPEDFYQLARKKSLKVYVEFPDHLPSGNTGGIQSTNKERLVVTSDFFGKKLPGTCILDAGLYSYVEVSDRDCHLKGANVAGFKTLVYGLENTNVAPILFDDGNVLISTTKFSDFRKSRYSPIHEWENAITGILLFLFEDEEIDFVQWEPLVKPMYPKNVKLPADAYKLAVERGVGWYINGRFLIHPEWENHWQGVDTLALPVGPPMDLDLPSGDGSLGVMEGHYSYINPDGSQPYRYWLRADCVSETAMTFAMADNIKKNGNNLQIAGNLLDFLFNSDAFKTPNSRNPQMSSYGLMGWTKTHPFVYYGDDNARVILGSILSSHIVGNNKWDSDIERLILANFRTAGKKGFRTNSLRGKNIDIINWKELYNRDIENPAPHFESWLWATYLWLYDKTGYPPLLDKAKSAIEITMGKYPKDWKWTNGLQQERARMILPLAWLVRIEDTPQNRKWLNLVCDDLLTYQHECGALREVLGAGSKGKYGAPKNNQHYGTTEAPVIQTNGEPIADMLYTSNFAFFALNEAAQVTKDPKYLEAVDKLADFLVRIQSTSYGRADLNGCWFRAFDYDEWEYYGSNADHGWGAWGTLTGWTQSFITTTLALKLKGTSYWELTKETTIGSNIEPVLDQMLPGIN